MWVGGMDMDVRDGADVSTDVSIGGGEGGGGVVGSGDKGAGAEPGPGPGTIDAIVAGVWFWRW